METEFDAALSDAERAHLRRIAGTMIPASEEYGVPGADDPLIFADIIRSLGRDLGDVRSALAELAASAGGDFAAVDAARIEQAIAALCARGDGVGAALSRAVLQCYYRDDRVLRALGHEPRPPFPQGHKLEQGDWSLLDAVRHHPQLWRDDRAY
ncbi:MAG TPA: hypothetical protein VMB34_02585 [Acetobacteraceae bacterium]|nr:hypothetical protein [Acetobacteraceae bacterium]